MPRLLAALALLALFAPVTGSAQTYPQIVVRGRALWLFGIEGQNAIEFRRGAAPIAP